MNKNYLIVALFFLSMVTCGQVGINTPNPQGVFNIDAAGDNSASGTPSAAQQANDVMVTPRGNVGIGTVSPTHKVHINGTDPLRLQGLTAGNSRVDPLMGVDANGVVKTIGSLNALSIPTPAIFRLETAQENFLDGRGAGGQQVVPMSLIKNAIPGLTYANNTINFPPGSYQVTFVYEAYHNVAGCNLSSYFVDFPVDTGRARVHSTASHGGGGASSHGNSITYASTISTNRAWTIQLGRGQSGNCSGSGMNLMPGATQLLIFRLGD